MPQSAAVVDLNEFRRRREARPEPKTATPMRPPVATVPVPVVVCWVPVWVVA